MGAEAQEILSESEIESLANAARFGWSISGSEVLRLVATLAREQRWRDDAAASASKQSAELRTIIVRREAERDAARALLARAAATIREHLASLPRCRECCLPGTHGIERSTSNEILCDEHAPVEARQRRAERSGFSVARMHPPFEEVPEYPRAKTVRELQALVVEIEVTAKDNYG